jgi:hypothetical protein
MEVNETPTLPDTKYYVLLMTAVVMTADAQNEIQAAHRALLEGPAAIDPTRLSWVVKHVSDQPIYLAEEGEVDEVTEMIEEAASSLILEP